MRWCVPQVKSKNEQHTRNTTMRSFLQSTTGVPGEGARPWREEPFSQKVIALNGFSISVSIVVYFSASPRDDERWVLCFGWVES